MNSLPFDQPGRFWRGNLHTHSTASDGQRTPEEVCGLYAEAGYDFLALTDHFLAHYGFPLVDTGPFRTSTFTTILGAELHAGVTELGGPWHILAVGLPLDFAPSTPAETGPQIAQRALAAGAFVAVAHPQWYTLTEADALSLGPVHAVETYNATSADYNDRDDSLYMLDLLCSRGHRYFALATDDAHFNPARHDAMRGWVWVKSETLAPDALLAALKAGHYYSSTGPQIHDIQVKPGVSVTVRCSPAARVFVTGALWAAVSVAGHGLTQAELSLQTFASPYCRVTVRDEYGRRAWSNPIWFD
ncbi:MAG: CehA/McbA family metallohydrolase [Anaerolineae bacterium]|nr:CehA/McbA family metallohydrolase [Anaerolineae bacterium]